MTRDDIAAVMGKVPGLNAFGVGYCDEMRGRRRSQEDRERWMRGQEAALLDDTDGCSRAEAWLRDKVKRKTVNPLRSSYGLKHLAEREVGYITNGAFIAAAVHLGFSYEVDPHSPNPRIGISERCLKGLSAV